MARETFEQPSDAIETPPWRYFRTESELEMALHADPGIIREPIVLKSEKDFRSRGFGVRTLDSIGTREHVIQVQGEPAILTPSFKKLLKKLR